MENGNDLTTYVEVEDPAETLRKVRRHLTSLVDRRTSGPLCPRDETMYRLLCDAECELLNRAPRPMPAPRPADRRSPFLSVVSSSSSASRVLAN